MVVDTEVTSKLLLERGQLQTRTTIIPLNKISSRVIGRDTLRVAQEVVSSGRCAAGRRSALAVLWTR